MGTYAWNVSCSWANALSSNLEKRITEEISNDERHLGDVSRVLSKSQSAKPYDHTGKAQVLIARLLVRYSAKILGAVHTHYT